MNLLAPVVLLLYFAALLILAVFSGHRLYLLWLLRSRPALSTETNEPGFPFVTVQLPVFNERYVIVRALDAIGRLRYPLDRMELQVLDDSSDDTSDLIGERVIALRQAGWSVAHLHRSHRRDFKAGALAAGARVARGELVLVMDADFVTPPNLLTDLVPHFSDPRVAMVQARWGHLNADENRLTRVQALLLDAHFLLETAARAARGLFFNFHGTAAAWRSAAIADAGGWQGDTLTEDLDLSYRAQLRGWKFIFLPDLIVPAELPTTLSAFKQQQARWAEGTMATARKHLSKLLGSALPIRIKLEALVHLLSHIVYPAALIVALLALPAMLLRARLGWDWLGWIELALLLAIVLPNRFFFRRAARLAGRAPPGWREMPVLMLTGVALAVSNTLAVLRGLGRKDSVFNRTPKSGGLNVPFRLGYAAPGPAGPRAFEALLAVYLIFGLVVAVTVGSNGAIPAFAFLAIGFGSTAARG